MYNYFVIYYVENVAANAVAFGGVRLLFAVAFNQQRRLLHYLRTICCCLPHVFIACTYCYSYIYIYVSLYIHTHMHMIFYKKLYLNKEKNWLTRFMVYHIYMCVYVHMCVLSKKKTSAIAN